MVAGVGLWRDLCTLMLVIITRGLEKRKGAQLLATSHVTTSLACVHAQATHRLPDSKRLLFVKAVVLSYVKVSPKALRS